MQMFNDNSGIVYWSYGKNISKWLRHINIQESAMRDDIDKGDVMLSHLPGNCNIADLFTKEIRDVTHFQTMAFRLISAREIGGCQSWMTRDSPPSPPESAKDTFRPSSPTSVMF